MVEQKYIGVVASVNSGIISILVDPKTTSLKREINGKTYYIGQIGTYFLIPMGTMVLLGMVSDLKKEDLNVNGQAQQRYIILASMVGTVKSGRFERGVSIFPVVDMPVFFAEDADLAVAFATFQRYGFSIGQISLFENQRAFLDANKFFGKHIAVLGSSGSGKSCAVASILQKVSKYPDTNIIILDIHNEYHKAFEGSCNHLDIGEFELPYWLMNFDELREMFIDDKDENASSQITVLKDLVIMSKRGKNPEMSTMITIDTPVYYDISEIRAKLQFMDTEKITMGATVKEGPFYGKFARFLVRLDGKLNDPRYAFMFRLKNYIQSAAINDLLSKILGADGSAQVTILDMSGVPFDIVNTIVSLLARLIFDFNFWNPNRRDFPILLVFEEAHNYLPSSGTATASARKTVERIAKEGRKYGVSCMIVSQRPSEVSETILSQCNNYVVLRLTNPLDQNYIRRLVPDTFASLTDVLPSLRTGEALVVGEAISMPLRVQIDYPNPEPDSSDIRFYEKWKQSDAKTKIAEVVTRWWKQEKVK
ncbi:MAG: ATP-binding protein [Ignavibacteriales bacterium]|nr:ATP-binding protein [Ignavibacteriales bacterium]